MPIGDEVYFSELDGSESLKIDGTNTLLHTFADNNTYETWLYASAPANTTVTITSPLGSVVDLTVSATTEVALLNGQMLSYGLKYFNSAASSVVFSLAVQSDGKILLGGSFTSVGGTTRNYIARVHANGALDTTFNPMLITLSSH
jgi:hypothetical protein